MEAGSEITSICAVFTSSTSSNFKEINIIKKKNSNKQQTKHFVS